FKMQRLLPIGTISLVYIVGAPSTPWSRGLSILHPDLSSYCLMKVMSPPYFELEELGVLIGVEYIALLGPVYLLLEHPVVAVGDCLIQDGVLLWVVVDRRPPELLHEAFIAHPS
ncbi:MAG: hypothetical protein ACKO96_29955, partial [Flammeovirgaceae bacterium]